MLRKCFVSLVRWLGRFMGFGSCWKADANADSMMRAFRAIADSVEADAMWRQSHHDAVAEVLRRQAELEAKVSAVECGMIYIGAEQRGETNV